MTVALGQPASANIVLPAPVEAPAAAAVKPRGRLFRKYVAMLGLVVSAVLLINGCIEAWFSYHENTETLLRLQRAQAAAAAEKIGRFVKEIDRQVVWTTQLSWTATTLEERRFDALRLFHQVPAVTEITEIDPRGREQLRLSRTDMDVIGSGIDRSGTPAFKEAKENKAYYSPVYFRRDSEPYITMALAGRRSNRGVSVAEVNLKSIWDVVSQIKVGEHGWAYVVDGDGRLIAHPDLSLVLRKTDFSQLSQFQTARNDPDNVPDDLRIVTDHEGRRVLSTYASIQPMGWIVFTELPLDEVYAPLFVWMKRAGLLFAAGLALALLSAFMLARKMVGPIQSLRAGAARIGAGQLDQRIAISTGDELEDLADQFNEMANRLHDSYAVLEKKVEDRTRDLAEREAVLRVMFDNMVQGVAMFDAERRLVGSNTRYQSLLQLPENLVQTGIRLDDIVRYMAERGELGSGNIDELVRKSISSFKERLFAERVGADGISLEIHRTPLPGGGALYMYTDITERKKAQAEIERARDAAEKMLTQLKTAQNKLVHSEKMASLGQLTAGIAHEIKNPLNFVNNFSSLSNEMLDELKEILAPMREQMTEDARDDVDDVMETLSGNLKKIGEHGRRADGIVKSMLMHSRGGSGERRSTDLNALIEEALNLAYHGARAQDQTFNVTMEKDFDAALTKMDVVPQDLTRVFINLFGNGFYATEKRKKEGGDAAYRPTVKVSTRVTGDEVEINVRDNGIGMTPQVREKLFTPFFTTKPTGEGTGLGLSITHDIVVQLHGGAINVDSAPNEFTQFTIRLPRNGAAAVQQPAGGTA